MCEFTDGRVCVCFFLERKKVSKYAWICVTMIGTERAERDWEILCVCVRKREIERVRECV
jgi:hypothetical protein